MIADIDLGPAKRHQGLQAVMVTSAGGTVQGCQAILVHTPDIRFRVDQGDDRVGAARA